MRDHAVCHALALARGAVDAIAAEPIEDVRAMDSMRISELATREASVDERSRTLLEGAAALSALITRPGD